MFVVDFISILSSAQMIKLESGFINGLHRLVIVLNSELITKIHYCFVR